MTASPSPQSAGRVQEQQLLPQPLHSLLVVNMLAVTWRSNGGNGVVNVMYVNVGHVHRFAERWKQNVHVCCNPGMAARARGV